tara:strand:+ start:461 stop:637 length:177 start_codon:yes stop_codon:yes gene_type:complete
MQAFLSIITIVSLAICGPGKNIVIESQEIKKPINSDKTETIIFKKVPTKWVKITKKSN